MDWATDAKIIVKEKNAMVSPNKVVPCSSVFSQDNLRDYIAPLSSSIINAGKMQSLAAT
jgi:hypothetical protein